jgi:hypothetical protein
MAENDLLLPHANEMWRGSKLQTVGPHPASIKAFIHSWIPSERTAKTPASLLLCTFFFFFFRLRR